jgi:hypothetical protein
MKRILLAILRLIDKHKITTAYVVVGLMFLLAYYIDKWLGLYN